MEIENSYEFEKIDQSDISLTYAGGIQCKDLSKWMGESYEYIKNKRFW